jgi:hypothetical protein
MQVIQELFYLMNNYLKELNVFLTENNIFLGPNGIVTDENEKKKIENMINNLYNNIVYPDWYIISG